MAFTMISTEPKRDLAAIETRIHEIVDRDEAIAGLVHILSKK